MSSSQKVFALVKNNRRIPALPWRTAIYAFVTLLSALAASSCQNAPDPQAEEADRKAAEAKLEAMLKDKEAHNQRLEELRQRNQQQAEAEEARQLEAERRARYSPQRRASALKPRKWASVTVPDLNIKAVFNSNWADDHLNYRVALLGQKDAIDVFLSRAQVGVNFADQSGNKIFEFPIPSSEFQWAPPGFNQGIPTVQATGRIPLELPTYEQSVQWNLTW